MHPTTRLAHRIPTMKLPSQPPVTPRTPPRTTAAARAAMHPVDDRDNLYHGLGLNAPLARQVWRTGLMSQNEARRRSVSLAKNFVGGHNGKQDISVSRYMGHSYSFAKYSAGKLSLIIDAQGLDARSFPYGGFSDEYHVSDYISPARFRGLMVPKGQLDAPIRGLRIGLTGGPAANLEGNTQAYVDALRAYNGAAAVTSDAAASLGAAVQHYRRLPLNGKLGPEGTAAETAVEEHLADITATAYVEKVGDSEPTLRQILAKTLPEGVVLFEL